MFLEAESEEEETAENILLEQPTDVRFVDDARHTSEMLRIYLFSLSLTLPPARSSIFFRIPAPHLFSFLPVHFYGRVGWTGRKENKRLSVGVAEGTEPLTSGEIFACEPKVFDHQSHWMPAVASPPHTHRVRSLTVREVREVLSLLPSTSLLQTAGISHSHSLPFTHTSADNSLLKKNTRLGFLCNNRKYAWLVLTFSFPHSFVEPFHHDHPPIQQLT